MPEVAGKTGEAALGPRYTLLLSNDSADIDAVQRLRYDVFSSEPGFQLASTPEAFEGRDADRFDEHCDHLLVREDVSGDVVGCYRMLLRRGLLRPEDSTVQRNSISADSTRCGLSWWRWVGPWCGAITATARWCC